MGLSLADAEAKAKLKTAPRPAPSSFLGDAHQIVNAAGLLSAGDSRSSRRKDGREIREVCAQLAAGRSTAHTTVALRSGVAKEKHR